MTPDALPPNPEGSITDLTHNITTFRSAQEAFSANEKKIDNRDTNIIYQALQWLDSIALHLGWRDNA